MAHVFVLNEQRVAKVNDVHHQYSHGRDRSIQPSKGISQVIKLRSTLQMRKFSNEISLTVHQTKDSIPGLDSALEYKPWNASRFPGFTAVQSRWELWRLTGMNFRFCYCLSFVSGGDPPIFLRLRDNLP